jgi:hypothetical protein
VSGRSASNQCELLFVAERAAATTAPLSREDAGALQLVARVLADVVSEGTRGDGDARARPSQRDGARTPRRAGYNSAMLVEVLSFEGCPSADAAVALVNELVEELGIEAAVRHVQVESPEEATRLGFLGSPTIRVAGKDVEPGADKRGDYALACRVYRTSAGTASVPDRAWIHEALRAADPAQPLRSRR